MSAAKTITGAILGAALLCGCGAASARPEAENLARQYFEAMKRGDVDNVIDLYSKDIAGGAGRDSYKLMLTKINAKLGNVESYALESWDVTTTSGGARPGTFVTLTYNVRYRNSAGTESFNMFRPARGGPFRITQHAVNSAGLRPDAGGARPREEKPTGTERKGGVEI